jgi:hypothetical protein
MAEQILLVMSESDDPGLLARLTQAAQHYGDCAPLSKSIVAVKTRVDPQHLHHLLGAEAGIHQGILILPVKASYVGPAPHPVRQWLHEATLH